MVHSLRHGFIKVLRLRVFRRVFDGILVKDVIALQKFSTFFDGFPGGYCDVFGVKNIPQILTNQITKKNLRVMSIFGVIGQFVQQGDDVTH